jgi:hypothetical protein
MAKGASTSGGPRRGSVEAGGPAFLILALGALLGCGGPVGEPIPNDPHPVWVCSESSWYRFDQHGHRMGRFAARGSLETELVIYDDAGRRRRTLPGPGCVYSVAFDAKAGVVWVAGYEPSEERRDETAVLWKYDYDGRLLLETRAPSEIGYIGYIVKVDVYEEAGELWLLTFRQRKIYKFDADGNLLFSKTAGELGIPFVPNDDFFVDQADGGVWLYDDPNRTIVKISRDGKCLGSWETTHRLLDVARRTGDRLCLQLESENDRGGMRLAPKYYTEDQLHLYDREGVRLWSAPVPSFSAACISDTDGGVWYVRETDELGEFELGKFSREGAHVIRGVGLEGTLRPELMVVRRDPYGK